MPFKLILFAFVLIACSPVQAKIMTACIDHYPPLQFAAKKPYGESISALKTLAKVLEYKIEFVKGPNFARCLKLLELGKVDVLAGLVDNENRRKIALLVPYKKDTQYVFVIRKQSSDIKKYDDFKGVNVGVTKNTMYFKPFDTDKNIKKIEVKDIKTGLKLLVKGRVDVVITSDEIFNSSVKELRIAEKVKLTSYTQKVNRSLNFGFSKRSTIHITKSKIAKINQATEQDMFVKAINDFIAKHPQYY
jgi:ABC-type amino acid transport substrate-binding protein